CLPPLKSYTEGAANTTDEYVPTTIPIRMANENPLITSPPKTNNTANTKIMVNEVMIVRLKVELIAWLTVSPKSLLCALGLPKNSRKRSNTTTVSLTEYAITVKIAATKCWSISNENGTIPSRIENSPNKMTASWIVAIAAPTEYCHLWKRIKI